MNFFEKKDQKSYEEIVKDLIDINVKRYADDGKIYPSISRVVSYVTVPQEHNEKAKGLSSEVFQVQIVVRPRGEHVEDERDVTVLGTPLIDGR